MKFEVFYRINYVYYVYFEFRNIENDRNVEIISLKQMLIETKKDFVNLNNHVNFFIEIDHAVFIVSYIII